MKKKYLLLSLLVILPAFAVQSMPGEAAMPGTQSGNSDCKSRSRASSMPDRRMPTKDDSQNNSAISSRLSDWMAERKSSRLDEIRTRLSERRRQIPKAPTLTPAPSDDSASSAPASSSQSSQSSAPAPVTSDADATRQRILDLVNAERRSANLPALRMNSKLELSAQKHAEDMRSNNYFDHVNQQGLSPTDRMKAAGYNSSGRAYFGENIARGQTTPEQVMQGWMNSPGHRANILSANFEELGVGISGNYWVQNFGSLR